MKRVTSWSRSIACSTMAGPRKLVPPRTRIFFRELAAGGFVKRHSVRRVAAPAATESPRNVLLLMNSSY